MSETGKLPEPAEPAIAIAEEPEPITFAEFLERTPPGTRVHVENAIEWSPNGHEIARPDIQLHCPTDQCNGIRVFRSPSSITFVKRFGRVFLSYVCSNCRASGKTFALQVERENVSAYDATVFKFGEDPSYGPPTPNRLLRLFGADRELFLKGRRCENQGLGIGAFTYYRRVVENHKDRLLDEITRVAEKVGAPATMIEALATAKSEISFAKALEAAKDAIPETLLLKGHNPLALLHRALSGGVHEKTDEECLELAQDVRVVLAALAERLSQVLEEEAELSTALSRLLGDNRLERGPEGN
jgi:hypothetical protein